jgi:hypothetical protein
MQKTSTLSFTIDIVPKRISQENGKIQNKEHGKNDGEPERKARKRSGGSLCRWMRASAPVETVIIAFSYLVEIYGGSRSRTVRCTWSRGRSVRSPLNHGNNEFRGKVNNSFDPQRGYKGAKPNRGEKAEPAKRVDSATSKETKSGMDVATQLAAKADPRKRCTMLRRSSAPILCFTR